MIKEAYDRGCAAAVRDLQKLADDQPMSPAAITAMGYIPGLGGWMSPAMAAATAPSGMGGRAFGHTLGGQMLGGLGGAIPGALLGGGLGMLGGPEAAGMGAVIGGGLGALVGHGVGTYHGYKSTYSPEQQKKYFGE
jgi:hypothetical protein